MAKRKIVWSPNSKIDLLKILEYFYIRNGSKTYSVHLNSEIHKTVKLLSNHAFLGLQSDIEIVRSIVEGNYAILYQSTVRQLRLMQFGTADKIQINFPLLNNNRTDLKIS